MLDKQIQAHLDVVYQQDTAAKLGEQIQARLAQFKAEHPDLSADKLSASQRVTEADSILITYGDQVVAPDKPALQTLAEFLTAHLKGVVSSVHILPFYPYSSDDGFSVIDYKAINPGWGDWEDLAPIREDFRLMFDAVINHISAESDWFKGFLAGDPKYKNYFITQDPTTDLSDVTRPRTSPLLTPVETPEGTQHVWSTFSADQIDINYENPDVLLEIIDVLLFYVAHGAEFIRLDAIAYMWKEIGTSCIHLPETHRLIQLFRAILDVAAPNVLLITETNVPHKENVSYFGDGRNEAQMVYQFTLAPLVLHTFYTGNATKLQEWAHHLDVLPETATFFNFIASHDGIGVRLAEGILTQAEVQNLGHTVEAHGGRVSYKNNPDGSQSPYELNITLFDALSNPNNDEPESLQIGRFMASQAIMLAMVGVPGIYVHSLFGSSNDYVGMKETGRARTINRQKWLQAEVEAVLSNAHSRGYKVFQRYVTLLKARAGHRAFHPNSAEKIILGNPAFFAVERTAPDEAEHVLCVHNVTARPQNFEVDLTELAMNGPVEDILSDEKNDTDGSILRLSFEPYQVRWLAG